MISTNYPLGLFVTLFSSGISARKYAPGAYNTSTFRFFIASITSVVISAYVDTLGDNMFFSLLQESILLDSVCACPYCNIYASLLIYSLSEFIVPSTGFPGIALPLSF